MKAETAKNRPEALLIYCLKGCLNRAWLVGTTSHPPELAVDKRQEIFHVPVYAIKIQINLVAIYRGAADPESGQAAG
jgi:hypothetical protein